jgi:DNA-binding transcriptional ArsR family regulator
MPDAEMAALLQAVLEEVCAGLAPPQMATRERVAARLNDLVRSGHCSADELRRAGRDALIRAPTMWR